MTTHVDFILSTTRRVREVGAARVLDELRTAEGGDHHHTRATFTLWAIDRLIGAGLGDIAIVWHPLTDPRSILAWYDEQTLDTDEARIHFVAASKVLPGEPAPQDLSVVTAAA